MSFTQFNLEIDLTNNFSAGVGRAIADARVRCCKSTLITPHTGHQMRCGLDHDDRLREGFDRVRAAWM